MGSGNLLPDEILKDAKKQAEQIKKEAKAKAEAILAEANAEATQIKQRRDEQLKQQGQQEQFRELTVARMQQRRRLLEAQDELINQSFAEAEKRLAMFRKMPEYRKHLDGLAALAKRQLGEGAQLFVAREEVPLVSGAKQINIKGGLMAETEEVRLDMSFERKLVELRKNSRQQIGKLLFA